MRRFRYNRSERPRKIILHYIEGRDKKVAGAALFADVVGLLICVWKVVLKPDFISKLSPETEEEIPE